MKKKGKVLGEFEGWIFLECRFSSKNISSAFCSSRVRAQILQLVSLKSAHNVTFLFPDWVTRLVIKPLHWLDSSQITLTSWSSNHQATFHHDITMFHFPSIFFLLGKGLPQILACDSGHLVLFSSLILYTRRLPSKSVTSVQSSYSTCH